MKFLVVFDPPSIYHLSLDNCIARCWKCAISFFSKISKLPVIRKSQRYSYKYTLVPYKHTFLHNTSNLEQLVILGSNTEVQAHVPRLCGFLSCSTHSIFPPLKDVKQRAQSWIAPHNGHLLCRILLQHSYLYPVQASLESYILWSAMVQPQ